MSASMVVTRVGASWLASNVFSIPDGGTDPDGRRTTLPSLAFRDTSANQYVLISGTPGELVDAARAMLTKARVFAEAEAEGNLEILLEQVVGSGEFNADEDTLSTITSQLARVLARRGVRVDG